MNHEMELKQAIQEAGSKIGLDLAENDIVIENSKDPAHGDYATNVAMRNAKVMHCAPRMVAEKLIENFSCDAVEKIEIAGPGFINFFMKKESLSKIIDVIFSQKDEFGQGEDKNYKINVEFVSANPTGDLHLGHTRGAALGDAMANIYEKAGYGVTREYYLNDCGNQVEHLGHSLSCRYKQLFGQNIELDEDDYHGPDLIKIAEKIKEEFGDKYLEDTQESHDFFIRYGIDAEFGKIEKDLADFRVHFDVISHESDVRKGTIIEDTIKFLSDKGYVYEKDGATYLKTSEFLDDKDRPIIKSNGMYTYFMPDICYHYNKMSRGYDLLIDMLGADHYGYINRMKSALMMKGYDKDQLDILIYQIVRVYKNGEEVRMSKRTGKAITHRELVAEVGVDAVRYFFIDKAPNSHLDFNYDLALNNSNENPVFYAQYAYARCHSVLELGKEFKLDSTLKGCDGEKEAALLKHLAEYPNVIQNAASNQAPYKITAYIQKLAALIHGYYAANKIIDHDNVERTQSRLALIKACSIVLKNALTLIGVSAPEKM